MCDSQDRSALSHMEKSSDKSPQSTFSRWELEVYLCAVCVLTLLTPLGWVVYFFGGLAACFAGVAFSWGVMHFLKPWTVTFCTATAGAMMEYVFLQSLGGWSEGMNGFPAGVAAVCGALFAQIKLRQKAGRSEVAPGKSEWIKNAIHFGLLGPWLGIPVMYFLLLMWLVLDVIWKSFTGA